MAAEIKCRKHWNTLEDIPRSIFQWEWILLWSKKKQKEIISYINNDKKTLFETSNSKKYKIFVLIYYTSKYKVFWFLKVNDMQEHDEKSDLELILVNTIKHKHKNW